MLVVIAGTGLPCTLHTAGTLLSATMHSLINLYAESIHLPVLCMWYRIYIRIIQFKVLKPSDGIVKGF